MTAKIMYVTVDCPSGKRACFKRREASRAARVIPPDGPKLRPYRCQHCNLWHLGHLPHAVRTGELAADDLYGRRPPHVEENGRGGSRR